MSAPESRFVKACKLQPVDRTPVWFMRQAGRYMPEYRAVRKQYSLVEICKKPAVAAEVTITAAGSYGIAFPFFSRRRPGNREAGADERRHQPPAYRPRGGSRIRFRGGPSRVQAFWRASAGDRLLWRALHSCQLHDRRRRLAQLRPRQENDVLLVCGLG